MAYKERTKSKTQLIYEALDRRKLLTWEGRAYLKAMQLGYVGECDFDGYTGELTCDCLVLNDIFLRKWRNKFQVDGIVITAEALNLYEVKNYEGEYEWGSEKLVKTTGTTIENPLLKLNSNKVKMEIFLERSGYKKEVRAYVVYINPHFHMHGPKEQEKYLLRSQLKKHMEELNEIRTPLSPNDRKLAEELKETHFPDYVDNELPKYTFRQAKKGIYCPNCDSLRTSVTGKTLWCAACQKEMPARLALKWSIEEFQLLFPNEKLTTSRIQEWCAQADGMRIYRTLQRDWTPVRGGRHRYYV